MSSEQSRDPSAGQAVARGAAGRLLSERISD